MRKYLVLFVIMLLMLTGCGEKDLEDVVNSFANSVENSKSYKLNGTMEISSGEEIFTYSIDTYFMKDDYYKVVLVNQTNNHEQIILKNPDGLYVVTPSLNKSFKFDSVWPENSSQAYILGNLLDDIKNDPEATLETTDSNYIVKSTVDYPNNEELEYQKIYFDMDMNISKVEVYNEEDVVKIKVNFKSVDMKAKLSEDDFVLDDLIDTESSDETSEQNSECDTSACETSTDENCENTDCEEQTNATLENIIYPLYIPSNTYLSSSETITTDTGERVILTFSGDKNFVIVEETVSTNNEFEIIPVFGDPLMLNESIGALSSNSISWDSNNISYYLVSSDLSTEEMVSVALSLGNATTVMSTK